MENQSDDYLMMIEPNSKAEHNGEDKLINIARYVWNYCEEIASTRGFHVCSCGEVNDSRIYKTPKNRETNSLLVHYVKNHRNQIPLNEIDKLMDEYEKLKENYLINGY